MNTGANTKKRTMSMRGVSRRSTNRATSSGYTTTTSSSSRISFVSSFQMPSSVSSYTLHSRALKFSGACRAGRKFWTECSEPTWCASRRTPTLVISLHRAFVSAGMRVHQRALIIKVISPPSRIAPSELMQTGSVKMWFDRVCNRRSRHCVPCTKERRLLLLGISLMS